MGSRSASSFSVDMFVQTPIRSVVLHDVATQQLITKFYIDCIFSNDLLDRQNLVRQPPSSIQVHVPRCRHCQDSNSSLRLWSHYWLSFAHCTWRIYHQLSQLRPTASCFYHAHPVCSITTGKRSGRTFQKSLRLRVLAWAQRVVFQDLHHVWALLQANRG